MMESTRGRSERSAERGAERGAERSTERSAGADPMVSMLLRAHYAPPAPEEYWTGLQQRIVARLHETPPMAWWSALPEWRTAGLIAATIALLISGATLMREQSLDAKTRRVAAAAAYANPEEIPEGVPVVITVRARDSVPVNPPERFLNPFDP